MKKGYLLTVLCSAAILLAGCAKEVITVADMQFEEQLEATYIEIKELELKEKDADNMKSSNVQYCVVAIPAGYVESEETPGMYIHERSPLDSSNVYYSAYDNNDQDIDYASLTAEAYKDAVEGAYARNGQKMDITIESFEKQEVEGFPSYVIRTFFGGGEQKVEQLIYLIIADKIYTITYSQAADDELLAVFEVSAGRIRLIRKN